MTYFQNLDSVVENSRRKAENSRRRKDEACEIRDENRFIEASDELRHMQN